MTKASKFEPVKTRRLRDKIYRGLVEFANKPVGEFELRRLVEICCAHLLADRITVQQSIAELANKTLTPAQFLLIAWRLAANKSSIRRSMPVSGSSYQAYLGPAVVRVTAIEPGTRRFKDGRTKSGAWVRLEMQDGPAAGVVLSKFWSFAMCSRLARRGGAWPRKKAVVDVRYLYGAYLVVRMNPAVARDQDPAFDQVACTDRLKSRNQKLFNTRQRKKFACRMRRSFAELPCHRCPVGEDNCKAATHPTTFKLKKCIQCFKDEFHKDDLTNKCLNCTTQKGKA